MINLKICEAIEGRHLLQFWYEEEVRIVEPHMLAYNEQNHLCLSAWWVGGHSKSGKSPQWRQYLVSKMSVLTIQSETFPYTRPGYKPDGGKQFHDVVCALKSA